MPGYQQPVTEPEPMLPARMPSMIPLRCSRRRDDGANRDKRCLGLAEPAASNIQLARAGCRLHRPERRLLKRTARVGAQYNSS